MNTDAAHVLYLVHSLNPGGTERLAVDMAIACSKARRVSVVCLDEPGLWAADLRSRGLPVSCLWRQPGIDIGIPRCLAKYCRDNEVDIIHAHQCTPWFYASLSRLYNLRPRLLLEEHGRFYPEADKPLRRFVNRYVIANLTHRFIAVSHDIRNRLARFEGLDEKSIEVIYNGVSGIEKISTAMRRDARAEFGFADSEFVVGTVGRLDSIKNIPMLIRAINDSATRNDAVRGLIVGDGPEFGTVRALIHESGSVDRIRMTGFRGDARILAQCFDVFVLSSLSEGTSMALLEAMSVGIPVVVTDVGGNPEVVEDGLSGLVVPSGDVLRLSQVIDLIATDRTLSAQLAAGASRRIEEAFQFSTMMSGYESIYDQMLAASSG